MRRQTPATAVRLSFEAAARHQSFTKAAEELSLAQSAVCSMFAQMARCRMGLALIPRFLLEEELVEGKLVVANPHVLARKNAYYLTCSEGN